MNSLLQKNEPCRYRSLTNTVCMRELLTSTHTVRNPNKAAVGVCCCVLAALRFRHEESIERCVRLFSEDQSPYISILFKANHGGNLWAEWQGTSVKTAAPCQYLKPASIVRGLFSSSSSCPPAPPPPAPLNSLYLDIHYMCTIMCVLFSALNLRVSALKEKNDSIAWPATCLV